MENKYVMLLVTVQDGKLQVLNAQTIWAVLAGMALMFAAVAAVITIFGGRKALPSLGLVAIGYVGAIVMFATLFMKEFLA